MHRDETGHKIVKNYHGLLIQSKSGLGVVPAVHTMLELIVTGYRQAEIEGGHTTLVINVGVMSMALLDTELGHQVINACLISSRT